MLSSLGLPRATVLPWEHTPSQNCWYTAWVSPASSWKGCATAAQHDKPHCNAGKQLSAFPLSSQMFQMGRFVPSSGPRTAPGRQHQPRSLGLPQHRRAAPRPDGPSASPLRGTFLTHAPNAEGGYKAVQAPESAGCAVLTEAGAAATDTGSLGQSCRWNRA